MAKESQGIIAYWATVTVEATLAANVIGELTGFSGPSLSAAVIDITHLQSTAKEKMVGVYDGGQVTLNVNWNCSAADGTKLMRESLVARTKGRLAIFLNGSAGTQKIGLKGFVSGMNVTGSVDNKLAGDFTIAITGGASFTS
jgi:hypothetical protein